jgi:hypothetical protein
MRVLTVAAVLLAAGYLPIDGLATAGWAAGEVRECRKDCKRRLRGCLRSAKTERRVAAKACKAASPRRPCRAGVGGRFRTAKRTCRTLRASCRTCCKAGGGACAGEAPLFDGVVSVPDRRVLNELPLPPGPGAIGFAWLGTADGTLVIDPARRTPVSAAAECAAFVLACFRPGVRNWAGCFEAAPPCPSETSFLEDGGLCCPAACGARYQELRQAGLDGPTAVTRAIWDAPSCIPGLVGRSAEEAP